ncbi:MAG TPA: V-type ATP synthase subunit D [Candidatus Nanopelagicaceae bacterium]|nr:V-type ATP synthase subunit D [Candidatus Nanopelagicaceae bacterium]
MTDVGRAGKMRVERRLEVARNGARLLDRKQHILADELEKLQLQVGRSRKEWNQRAGEAAIWLQRSAALDGSDLIRDASPAEGAEVELHWGGALGVVYPEGTDCKLPVLPKPGGSSALSYAVKAHRAALIAAVAHASVERAILLVSTELNATRVRQRAVENRWIPKLEGQLLAIRKKIAEQELEESLRLRWALRHGVDAGASASGMDA